MNTKSKTIDNNKEIIAYGRKNRIKGMIIGTIIGGLIFGGIGTAAVTLTAKEIKYTPSNENFAVTNAKEALDEIYKIAEYEIPSDTYFYDSKTQGGDIVRYKKVDGKYYLCDENGKVTNNEEQDISTLELTEYTLTNQTNLSQGKAGFAFGNLYLGNGNDKTAYLGQLDFEYIDIRQGGNYTTSLTFSNLEVGEKYLFSVAQASDNNASFTGFLGIEEIYSYQTMQWIAVSGAPGILYGTALSETVTINFASHNGGITVLAFKVS